MRSPFTIFRKHAKLLTVILTGLAMFAFIVMDQIQNRPELFPIIMGALLMGVAFWILGRPSGHSNEYGVAGLLLGVILMAYVRPAIWGPPPAVTLNIGDISQQELQNLRRRRQIANSFLRAAAAEAEVPLNRSSFFGPPDDHNVVLGHILRHEADEMGIQLSDKAVNEFIKQVTQNKLSREGFKKVRNQLQLSEPELYDVLKDELRANIAFQMLSPDEVATPHDYWEYYRRLNVKSEVAVVPVPTGSFVAETAPSDDEVQVFFEQYKNNYPQPFASPVPAFGQPRKIRIAYLQVQYEKTRSQVEQENPVTPEEIQNFYERYKGERFKNRIPDEPFGAPGTFPERPVEAPVPGTEEPSLKGPADSQEEPSGSESSPGQAARRFEQPLQPVSFQQPDGIDQPAGDDAAARAGMTPANSAGAVEAPVPGRQPEAEPLPEFIPLEEVRDEIRQELLERRTIERVSEIRRKAAEFMREIEGEYGAGFDDDSERLSPEEIESRVKAYAKQHGLRYVELDLLSAAELSERGQEAADLWNELQGTDVTPSPEEQKTLNYLIVEATEVLPADVGAMTERTSVLQSVFQTRQDELYISRSAEDGFSRDQYVYWKTGDVEPHVPTLDEPGVREQVVEALQQYRARKPARQRAEALAEKLREAVGEGQPLQEALETETITGKQDGAPVQVRDTGESFSWLRTSTAQSPNPFRMSQPELSTISAVEKAGNAFMRVVFEELDVGEVGVAPNADHSVYYVVYVKDRTPRAEGGLKAFRDQFMRENFFEQQSPFFGTLHTPYSHLVTAERRQATQQWADRLMERYGYQGIRRAAGAN